MRIKVQDITTQRLFIGWTGENKHAEFEYDFSAVFAEYPGAAAYMTVKPPAGEAYPHELTREGDALVWTVLASDCARAGDGSYQFTFTQGETVAKTFTGFFTVRESLAPEGDPPDPVSDWIAEAEGELTALKGMRARAETLDPEEAATASMEEEDGHKTIVFGIPKGPQGPDGISPTITVTDIPGGHRVTITDAEHPEGVPFDVMDGESGGGAVQDVQVNGVSVLQDGVANIKAMNGIGVGTNGGERYFQLAAASLDAVKRQVGSTGYQPISVYTQHAAAFYGLAKAAGDTTQSQSSNPVGQYTESAKSAISEMLSGSVSVSGTTPTINALPGIRYVCGEVTTLDIVTPATGIVDVVFTSGATPTVLTVTPPTGVTEVEWADGFDPDSLSANVTYWLKVIDGELGVATAWGVQSGGEGGETPYTLIVDETFAEDIVSNTWNLPSTYNEFMVNLLVAGTDQNTAETTGKARLFLKSGSYPSGMVYTDATITSLVRKTGLSEYTISIKHNPQTGITEFHAMPFVAAYIQTNTAIVGEIESFHLTTENTSRYIAAGTKLKIYAR